MNEQPDLFSKNVPPPTLPSNYTDTSRAAAKAGRTGAPRDREIIWAMIACKGPLGLTIDEIVAETGKLVQTVTGRVNDLQGKRWNGEVVIDSGKRRKTRSGSTAIVWVLARWRSPNHGAR